MQVISHTKHAVNLSRAERMVSMLGGGLLLGAGLGRRSVGGLALAGIGCEMIRRGVTGHSLFYEAMGIRTAPKGQGAETTSVPYELGIRVDESITVLKPRQEVYRFWRDLENLPRVMNHIESVHLLNDRRSHWEVKGPGGRRMGWDAEIHNEIENERIAWRSLDGAKVDHAGSVQFSDAPGGRGTEVRVEFQYNPPGGAVSALLAHLFGTEPSQRVREDLRRFKSIMETGDAITIEGQPRGSEEPVSRDRSDVVGATSEQSFPASDAPAWNR